MIYSRLVDKCTFNEIVEGIRTVLAKIHELREDLPQPASDGRHVGLGGMEEAIASIGITINAITGSGLSNRVREKNEVLESFSTFIRFEGKPVDRNMTVAATMWRIGILTVCHFKTDSLFQNILGALGCAPGRTGFGTNMKELLGRIRIPTPVDAIRILEASTFIRNSLHNNGIHRGNDWGPFNAHGLTFEFVKNYDVKCASFGHILAILDRTVDVLRDVLESQEVSSLSVIEDRYCELNP